MFRGSIASFHLKRNDQCTILTEEGFGGPFLASCRFRCRLLIQLPIQTVINESRENQIEVLEKDLSPIQMFYGFEGQFPTRCLFSCRLPIQNVVEKVCLNQSYLNISLIGGGKYSIVIFKEKLPIRTVI